jgi:hypothetical protein
MTIAAATTQHVFETAGLGRAPFRYLGCFVSVGPIKLADGSEVGAPGQPMGTCSYCGAGIKNCCRIKSSDGIVSIVGCDCVAKTGDKGLKALVQKQVNVWSKEREQGRVSTLQDRLVNDQGLRSLLMGMAHPKGFKNRETGEELTMLDQVEWMMANSGHAGRMRMVRSIAKTEA